MNRTIDYQITEIDSGLRVEQFLRRRGYSAQNLACIKRMPQSVIVNGSHYYMRDKLSAGDCLSIRIQEAECSKKISCTKTRISLWSTSLPGCRYILL